jgi:hypothetical protein
MCDAGAVDHLAKGQPKDAQIERKRLPAKIILIVLNLDRYCKLIPPVDLGPSGNPGNQAMNSSPSSQLHQVILVEKRRPWPDKAHIALENAKELRQFVQTEFSQNPADRRNIFLRVLKKMGGDCRRVDTHCSELRHLEDRVVYSDSIGPVKRRSFRAKANESGNYCHRNAENQQENNGQEDVEQAFHRENSFDPDSTPPPIVWLKAPPPPAFPVPYPSNLLQGCIAPGTRVLLEYVGCPRPYPQ